MVENAILTELTNIWMCILFINGGFVFLFVCMVKKVNTWENKIIKICAITLIATILSAISINIFFSVKPVTLATAYFEYKNNNIREIVGLIEDIHHDKAKKIIVIEGQEYVLLNGLEVNVIKGERVKIILGDNSNYIFALEPIHIDQ